MSEEENLTDEELSDTEAAPIRLRRRSKTYNSLSSAKSFEHENPKPDSNLNEYLCLNLVFTIPHLASAWFGLIQICASLTFSSFIFYFPSKIPPWSLFWLEFCLISFLQYTSNLEKFLFILPMVHIYKSMLTTQNIGLVSKAIFFIPSIMQYENIFKFCAEVLFILYTSQIKSPESIHRQSILEIGNATETLLSPYFGILSKLETSEKILSKKSENSEINKVKKNLKEVIKNLRNNPNIYVPKMEDIIKDLDIEDKIYIQQNSLISQEFQRSSSLSVRALNDVEVFYSGDELFPILKRIGKDWNFKTLFISDCTGDKALYTCGEYVFKQFNFTSEFGISNEVLSAFLTNLESKYLPNSYHNSCHAADVMNSFLFLCSSFSNLLPTLEIFACVLACMGHDVSHPGKNNRFLIQTKDPLAVCYNDISVLENMHSRELFTIFQEESSNIIKNIKEYWEMRKLIIELILATDMAKHFEFLASFRPSQKTIQEKLENFADRLEIYKLCIKASDIGHTAKAIELHEKWCKLIVEEFYQQGDEEKRLGLPVSMYCDRVTTDIRKSQAGFLKNIALPLFYTLKNTIKSDEIDEMCVQQIHKNVIYWERRKDSFRMNSMMHNPDDESEFTRTELRRITVQNRKLQ